MNSTKQDKTYGKLTICPQKEWMYLASTTHLNQSEKNWIQNISNDVDTQLHDDEILFGLIASPPGIFFPGTKHLELFLDGQTHSNNRWINQNFSLPNYSIPPCNAENNQTTNYLKMEGNIRIRGIQKDSTGGINIQNWNVSDSQLLRENNKGGNIPIPFNEKSQNHGVSPFDENTIPPPTNHGWSILWMEIELPSLVDTLHQSLIIIRRSLYNISRMWYIFQTLSPNSSFVPIIMKMLFTSYENHKVVIYLRYQFINYFSKILIKTSSKESKLYSPSHDNMTPCGAMPLFLFKFIMARVINNSSKQLLANLNLSNLISYYIYNDAIYLLRNSAIIPKSTIGNDYKDFGLNKNPYSNDVNTEDNGNNSNILFNMGKLTFQVVHAFMMTTKKKRIPCDSHIFFYWILQNSPRDTYGNRGPIEKYYTQKKLTNRDHHYYVLGQYEDLSHINFANWIYTSAAFSKIWSIQDVLYLSNIMEPLTRKNAVIETRVLLGKNAKPKIKKYAKQYAEIFYDPIILDNSKEEKSRKISGGNNLGKATMYSSYRGTFNYKKVKCGSGYTKGGLYDFFSQEYAIDALALGNSYLVLKYLLVITELIRSGDILHFFQSNQSNGFTKFYDYANSILPPSYLNFTSFLVGHDNFLFARPNYLLTTLSNQLMEISKNRSSPKIKMTEKKKISWTTITDADFIYLDG